MIARAWAAVEGGPEVWELVSAFRDHRDDREGLREHFGWLADEKIEAALEYYERFPDRVEAQIEENERAGRFLAEADDLELLRAAADEGRVVVTRNYRDVARLAEALAGRGEASPGVLFLSPAIPPADPSVHVKAVRRWRKEAGEENPVESTVGWVGPA